MSQPAVTTGHQVVAVEVQVIDLKGSRMAAATTLLGLLPTAAAIKIWAPILLTVLRIFQGISAGGEVGVAVSLVVEPALEGKRGVYGAWTLRRSDAGFHPPRRSGDR